MFANQWLDSFKEVFDDANIDELLDKQHSDLSARIENWILVGLGWELHSLL